MPRGSKRARNCKDMRAAKKRKAEDALYDILDIVLDLIWKLRVRRTGLRPSTTGYWEEPQLDDESGGQPESLLSDSESDSEEMEMTDDAEEVLPFNGCAFETLLTGSQRDRIFEEAVFPYQRGPVPTLRSQRIRERQSPS